MAESVTLALDYKPPYNFGPLLKFFRDRQLDGVELIDDSSYSRTVQIDVEGELFQGWIRVENEAAHDRLLLTLSESLGIVAPQVEARICRQFDLDSDPYAVASGIASLNDVVPGAVVLGTRLPGCFEPFETACRAVLGQQISVVAASRMAARIVRAYGEPINTSIDGLTHAFPTAKRILQLADMSAEELACTCCNCGKCETPGDRLAQGEGSGIEAVLGHLGVIRSRSRTIYEIARQVEEGSLPLSPDSDIEEQMEALLATKGIGPWSANYIAMRVMAYPDAFLETDVGVKHALPDLTPAERLKAAEDWRPWRSYANISLWQSLG